MTTVKLPHFGIIDSELLEEYYNAEVEYSDTEILIDLNFENKSIDPEKLEIVKQFIDNIRIHDLNNKKHIRNDFDDRSSDVVRDYIYHHLEVLPLDEIEDLIGANIKSEERPLKLLNKLHLVRVGIYPEVDEFAVFDYTIHPDITNFVIAVTTDENGNLNYITMEN